MTKQEIKQLSPLGLAYIGDGIYELMTRTRMIKRGNMPVNKLHRLTVSVVCAASQSASMELLLNRLSEEEEAVYRRGRNAHSGHVPKNADLQAYRRATGLEALFGYLYLCGEMVRLHELYEIIWQGLPDGLFSSEDRDESP